MRFREWLITEAGASGTSGGMHSMDWSDTALYPTNAYDGSDSLAFPFDTAFLQVRWQIERKNGRKFNNINYKEYEDKKFTSVYSNTLPDTKPGFWKHKPDTQSNLRFDTDAELKIQGIRKSADIAEVLFKKNKEIDKEAEHNRLFGKFVSKYPEVSKDFDKPWTNKYEK